MSTRVISDEERHRLRQFLASYAPRNAAEASALAMVRSVVDTASIVPVALLPRTVVSMYSTVKVVDQQRKEAFTYTVTYPTHASDYRSYVSLLSPLGAALIGSTVGAVVAFEDTTARSVIVKEILYQPEWDERNRFAQGGYATAR